MLNYYDCHRRHAYILKKNSDHEDDDKVLMLREMCSYIKHLGFTRREGKGLHYDA